uniref:Gfo/Idh/MocA-like oxidoreductase N-terminal domain-containing protein n=1 Tax=Romanomermis culicivorax TaxID=13658 RepID=A0A915I6J6_ROMCU
MAKNVGLIFGGKIENCEFFLECLSKWKYNIAALWTPKLEITVQLAAGFGIPFAANKPDDVVLRKDVEMVIIDCRPSLKCHIVLSALGIGKHVLCSAPMSLNLQEAISLLDASKYYPQLLAHVAYSNELRPALIKIRDHLINNSLGSSLFCDVNIKCPPISSENVYDWTWDCDAGGGVLNQIGSYFIDAMRFLLSAKARHVLGTLCRLNSKNGRNGQYSEHR